MKRYPKYKDSGVEWLGEVPEHWTKMPIRLAAKLESGHTPSRSKPEYWENCTTPWFTLADVWQIREEQREVITETEEKVSDLGLANSAARLLPAGTVMLSRTASVGFAAIMGVPMATTQDFANWVCGPTLLPKFLLRVFHAMKGEFTRLRYGSTHNTIYMPDIASFRFALPSMKEQTAIVEFLDRETAKIDGLVGEQRRLIELLKEKRQAVISHAVTKGLNPNAKLKPSGIDWLGDVPEHWEVVQLRRVLQQQLTNGIFKKKEEFGDGTLLVNVFDIYQRDYRVDFDALDRVRCSASEANAYAVRTGDLFFVRSSLKIEGIAAVAVAETPPQPAVFECHLVLARPNPSVFNGRFGSLLLNATVYRSAMIARAKVTTMTTVDQEAIVSVPVLIPPLQEQERIVIVIEREMATFDSLTAEAERAIGLLQERRTALISAAVTGKIDVRGISDADVKPRS